MDLAKALVSDVLNERVHLGKPAKADLEAKNGGNGKSEVEPILAEANQHLERGMGLAVHVLMGHANCKMEGNEGAMCPAMQKLEVWTFKLSAERPPDAARAPPMMPQFLRQALRSQLHFSPLRSWLSAKTVRAELFPTVKVSPGTEPLIWPTPQSRVQSHQFPLCSIPSPAGMLWLQLGVHWLKREHFVEAIPVHCPALGDSWILPNQNNPKKDSTFCCTTPSSYCSSDTEKSSNSDGSNPNSPVQRWKDPSRERKGQPQESGKKPWRSKGNEGFSSESEEEDSSDFEEENEGKRKKQKCSHPPRFPTPIPRNTGTPFNNVTAPICATPRPRRQHFNGNLHRRRTHLACKTGKTQENEQNLEIAEILPEPIENGREMLATPNQFKTPISTPRRTYEIRRTAPARLLCNFEESILNGRLVPTSVVDGYRLQLTIVPAKNTSPGTGAGFPIKSVTIPAQAHFYSQMSDEPGASTPTSLHLARCELGSNGIQPPVVPQQCNLQAILFNPLGSVVNIFMVELDLRDMPPATNTFIRQRTFSETGTTTTTTETGTTPTMPKSGGGKLRFLIHLRLASNETGQIHLHTDIRMLFSNKANELEGLETVISGGSTTSPEKSSCQAKIHSRLEMP